MAKAILAKLLIDGTGRDPIPNAVVIIEKGKIQKVSKQELVSLTSNSYEIIDTHDGILLPGLIDSHSHIFHITNDIYSSGEEEDPANLIRFIRNGLEDARSYISQGVTTIRNLGTKSNLDLGLRDLITQDKVVGPRIFGSGSPIAMTGRKPFADNYEVNSAAEARRAARKQLSKGADVVKLFASAGSIAGGQEQLTIEEMQAAVVEFHKAERTAAAHAIGAISIKNAVLAGVDSVEHATMIDEEGIVLMKKHDVGMVPTLAVGRTISNMDSETATHLGLPENIAEIAHTSFEEDSRATRMAHQEGIRIATGTDPVLQDTIAKECAWLHKAGLAPLEVIVAATRTGAELIHMDDVLGTIEVGKLADLVIVENNPLEDLSALEDVSWVFKEGDALKSPKSQLKS